MRGATMMPIEIRRVNANGKSMFEISRGKQFLVDNFGTGKSRFASEKQFTIDDISRWETIAEAVAVLSRMFPEEAEGVQP